MSESLVQIVTSTGGGLFIGIILGYFLKKIAKILTFIAGGIVSLLLYLQYQQVIFVDVEKLEASSTFILSSVVSSFHNITQIDYTANLGIPTAGGLSAGFAIGLTRG